MVPHNHNHQQYIQQLTTTSLIQYGDITPAPSVSVESTDSLPQLESTESQSSATTLATTLTTTSKTRFPIVTDGRQQKHLTRPSYSRSLCFHRTSVPSQWLTMVRDYGRLCCQGLPAQGFTIALLLLVAVGSISYAATQQLTNNQGVLRLAMVGNSMMYFNDFPRFLEALSDSHIQQDSCLHGDASLPSILITGSGTYKVWRTGVAQIQNASVELYQEYGDSSDNDDGDFTRLYDYGACTIPQLLFGYDKILDQKMKDWTFDQSYESHGDDYFDDDDYYTVDNDDAIYAYDFESFFDGTNPCLMDPNYYAYRNYLYWGGGGDEAYDPDNDNDDGRHDLYPTEPEWDYIIMNDNTRGPAQSSSRQNALSILEQQYLLWFQETGATPVLLFTYAYDTPYRDMEGMLDIPTFTSLTYEGYRQYAELLSQRLPEDQQPKIAPVGLAFLTIWEESYDFWNSTLFHVDRVHASPHGTFLQGCVVYCTLYGKLPPQKTAIGQLESLWNDARRMAPVRHRRLPLPTREEATYLYHIAERVCLQSHVPKSFVYYENGESTNYIPSDDAYKTDDIY